MSLTRPLLLASAIACLALSSPAQTLHFCSSYSTDGLPSGEANVWHMYEDGGNVYLLFRHQEDLKVDKLTFTVQKLEEDKPARQVATTPVEVKEGSSWVVLDHHFEEEGEYKVIVHEGSNNLASRSLTMKALRPGTNYTTSRMTFCSRVNDGEPADTLHKVTLEGGTVKARAFLGCPDGLSCHQITVDVWSLEDGDKTKYVTSQVFEVEPGWKFTQFAQPLTEKGRYRFMVYSDAGVWINTADIEVE